MYMQMINDLGLINEFLYSRATEIKCCWGLFLSKSTVLRLINIIGQIVVNIVLFLNNQYANILYFSDNNIYINIKQVILSRNWSRKLIWTSVVTQMKKQKAFSSRRSLAQGSLGFGEHLKSPSKSSTEPIWKQGERSYWKLSLFKSRKSFPFAQHQHFGSSYNAPNFWKSNNNAIQVIILCKIAGCLRLVASYIHITFYNILSDARAYFVYIWYMRLLHKVK